MKVYVYPADETGCGYYRLIWPAEALKSVGMDITIVRKKEMDNQFQAKMIGDKMVDVTIPKDADVIVLQRPTHKYLQLAVPIIRRKGVAVVIDMDDDLTSIDPRNPAFSILHPNMEHNPMGKAEHTWANARTVCELATLVTVSTKPLLDVYAKKCPGVVLKNYVPAYFTQREHLDSCVVGWGGSIHSHPDDLQSMGPAIARISREFPFVVVGPDKGLTEALGESVASRITASGKVEFLDWHEAITDQIGIGIAPTADTKFNRAKSWLKPLEYMACGVPAVSSARPEYVELMEKYGVGYVASTPKDWYRLVKTLARDGELRRDLAGSWRQIIADKLTIDRNAHLWAETWLAALRLERI